MQNIKSSLKYKSSNKKKEEFYLQLSVGLKGNEEIETKKKKLFLDMNSILENLKQYQAFNVKLESAINILKSNSSKSITSFRKLVAGKLKLNEILKA